MHRSNRTISFSCFFPYSISYVWKGKIETYLSSEQRDLFA